MRAWKTCKIARIVRLCSIFYRPLIRSIFFIFSHGSIYSLLLSMALFARSISFSSSLVSPWQMIHHPMLCRRHLLTIVTLYFQRRLVRDILLFVISSLLPSDTIMRDVQGKKWQLLILEKLGNIWHQKPFLAYLLWSKFGLASIKLRGFLEHGLILFSRVLPTWCPHFWFWSHLI